MTDIMDGHRWDKDLVSMYPLDRYRMTGGHLCPGRISAIGMCIVTMLSPKGIITSGMPLSSTIITKAREGTEDSIAVLTEMKCNVIPIILSRKEPWITGKRRASSKGRRNG